MKLHPKTLTKEFEHWDVPYVKSRRFQTFALRNQCLPAKRIEGHSARKNECNSEHLFCFLTSYHFPYDIPDLIHLSIISPSHHKRNKKTSRELLRRNESIFQLNLCVLIDACATCADFNASKGRRNSRSSHIFSKLQPVLPDPGYESQTYEQKWSSNSASAWEPTPAQNKKNGASKLLPY